MLDELRTRYRALRRRLGRIQHRELREFHRWLEHTNNLIHLSILLFVPLLIAIVTVLSNLVPRLALLLFPPIASGTYTLFADPEGRYASPRRFIGGLTAGAFCGWIALELSVLYRGGQPSGVVVSATAAALAILIAGIVTWLLDIEQPAAFSTALLILLTDGSQLRYVFAIATSSVIVSGVFLVWREQFYEQRAHYLYESTTGDDHILVPIRGENYDQTAMFAAKLAAAHEASKVVLLKTVAEASTESSTEGPILPSKTQSSEAAAKLEDLASRIKTTTGVPCQVVVATEKSSLTRLVLRVCDENSCDLIVTPYETESDTLSSFIRGLFRHETDVVVHRSVQQRTTWDRTLVMIDRPGDLAHSMLDFAQRLAGRTGHISVCKCIVRHTERREAERMLTALVEAFRVKAFETRVSLDDVEQYIADHGPYYDLVFIGASTDRSKASRILSPPTFERIQDIDSDIAIVHEGLD